MDFLLPLTILGFIISFYSVSEDYKKRNFIFKLSLLDIILFSTFLLFLIIVIFIQNFCLTQIQEPLLNLFKVTFTYSYLFSIIAFLLSAIIVIYFVIKLNSKKVIQKTQFIKNAKDNLKKHNYAILSADLDLYNGEILSQYNNYKLHKTELNQKFIIFKIIKENKENYCKTVESFYRELTNDSNYIKYLIENNFNSSLELLKVPIFGFDKQKLWATYGRYLMSNVNSKLYLELDDEYSGNQELINFLFEDTTKCAEMLTWKPIGDFVIEYIEDQKKEEKDKNNYLENNYDIVKQNSPIYIGIRFFDYMVSSALEQNTADHMWLFYLGAWSERICDNIVYEDDELPAEFKNMYEYYLYEIFDSYRHWITYILKNDYLIPVEQDANIIKSAINSFTSTMITVFESKNIRPQFKNYLREIYVNVYMDLAISNNPKITRYTDYFNERLFSNGNYPKVNYEFLKFLLLIVENPGDRYVWNQGLKYILDCDKNILNNFKDLIKNAIDGSENRNDI